MTRSPTLHAIHAVTPLTDASVAPIGSVASAASVAATACVATTTCRLARHHRAINRPTHFARGSFKPHGFACVVRGEGLTFEI
jgi:hypothetical protein